MVYIEPNGENYQLPGFSVLLSIVFMIGSLASFIYFIHSISQEIQINNILLKIYTSSEKKLRCLIDEERKNKNKSINTEHWIPHKTKCTGYFKILPLEVLVTLASENNFKLEILANKGSYCYENDILFKTNVSIDTAIQEKVYRNFQFSKGELIDDTYILAFKQITEVAVKSMSPGINDPGTAINAIDYLTELLMLRVQKKDIDFELKENEIFILVNSLNFKELLYHIMASLRTYCSHDIIVVLKLLTSLRHVQKKSMFEGYTEILENEIENLLTSTRNEITNKEDLKKLTIFYSN